MIGQLKERKEAMNLGRKIYIYIKDISKKLDG